MDHLDVLLSLRLFYLLASAIILVIYSIPALHVRFLQYGARSSTQNNAKKELYGRRSPSRQIPSSIEQVMDFVAGFRVPHGWFLHFYVASMASSIAWIYQMRNQGGLYSFIASHTRPQPSSMTISQIALCWFLMLAQGTRRLIECVTLMKPTKSKMWIGHYVIGVVFYVAVNISVWIEGIASLHNNALHFNDLALGDLPTWTVLYLLAFVWGSRLQYQAHVYLSKLKKYTLPTEGPFSRITAPHYTAECVIYMSIALLAAPPGQPINFSMASAWIFVCVNLGVSADMTRSWMVSEFAEKNVKARWRMIPGIW